jgi:hypothetical protein
VFRSIFSGLGWAVLRIIPFSREFRKCSLTDFREAGSETAITTFFSTMPLWIMPILGPVIFQSEIDFTDHLKSTIQGGELFVYCAALLGPLVYIITRKYGEIRKSDGTFNLAISFPHGLAFILFSVLICIIAGFAFSLMKNPALITQSTAFKLNHSGIFWLSIALYLLSLYCFFSASVYRNAMSGFVKSGHADEDSFAEAWASRTNAK